MPLTKLELVTQSAPADGSSNGVLFQKTCEANLRFAVNELVYAFEIWPERLFHKKHYLVFPDGKNSEFSMSNDFHVFCLGSSEYKFGVMLRRFAVFWCSDN